MPPILPKRERSLNLLSPAAEKVLKSFRICSYCASSWFTICTDVPEPSAILRRRDPLMILGLRRSAGVMDWMIALLRRMAALSASSTFIPLRRLKPEIISITLPRGPIFSIC